MIAPSRGALALLRVSEQLARPFDERRRLVVGGIVALAARAGRSYSRTRELVDELEDLAAVARDGRSRAQRLFLLPPPPALTIDLPPPRIHDPTFRGAIGGNGHSSGQPEDVVLDSMGRPAGPSEFRHLRAQLGGLRRAFVEAQSQRDDARARVKELLDDLRAARIARTDPATALLRADLAHAVMCFDVDCRRCADIETNLESGRAGYGGDRDLVDRLEVVTGLDAAARELAAALRDRSVGSQDRRARALLALERVLHGGP